MNGTPTSAIVSISREGADFMVTPVFVAVTHDMGLTDHEGAAPG